MATAGSKIKDDKQEYQYTIPWVTPSGHQFTFYDTPDNERLVVKHSSGSSIRFMADGSVFINAQKDLHTHASIVSSEGTESKAADVSTLRYDTDLNLVVQGRLNIRCASLDFEIGEAARFYAGTDMTFQSNNLIEKATESIALEGTKSIYVDTKEYRERSVVHKVEEGTMEDGSPGGMSILNVHGNAIIRNLDENGGITIASKGYLTLMSGKERIDIIGKYSEVPETEAMATFTQKIYAPKPRGIQDLSVKPGDYAFMSEAGASYIYGLTKSGSTQNPKASLNTIIMRGDEMKTILKGKRITTIAKGDDIKTLAKGNDLTTLAKGNFLTTLAKGNKLLTIGKGNNTETVGGQKVETYAKTMQQSAGGMIRKMAPAIFLN